MKIRLQPKIFTNKGISMQYYDKLLPRLWYVDGVLMWRDGRNGGLRAGTVKHDGYRYITCIINGIQKTIPEHTIVWLMHHDDLPRLPLMIDHIDYDTLNNKISNLRIVTYRQNTLHTRPNIGGTSIYKGVSIRSRINNKVRYVPICMGQYLGLHDSEIFAAYLYDKYLEYDRDVEYAFLNYQNFNECINPKKFLPYFGIKEKYVQAYWTEYWAA